MPFIMSYIDPVGTTHPNSFWVIRYFSMNLPNRDALLVYHGWHDVDAYATGGIIVGDHTYNVNNSTVFASYIEIGAQISGIPYFVELDNAAISLDEFFGSANQFAYINPLSIEIGSAGATVLIVKWPADLGVISGDLTIGVTIKVNGSTVTPSSAVQFDSNQEIRYTLPSAVGPTDTVTWAYDGSGNLLYSASIQPIVAITAENSIGAHWQFNVAENSGQFAIHF